MTLEQHLKAGELLTEIQGKLDELRALLPDRRLKARCRSAQKNLQNRLINILRFSHWEAEKNPDGSYAHSIQDTPYPTMFYG